MAKDEMTAQLKREKVMINHKRVLRMMRDMGIQGRIKRKYISTTKIAGTITEYTPT
jgi:hypothetical protein